MEEEDQTEELLRNILECLTNQNEKLQIIIDKCNNCELEDRISGSEGLYSSEENNSVDVNESVYGNELKINNFDNIHNTTQLESYVECEVENITEDRLNINTNSEHDTTCLVSTLLIHLKQFEQFNQSRLSNTVNTIDHINYQHNNIGTLPSNVGTIPVIDSVPVTAYSSQFKVWDPGLRAA